MSDNQAPRQATLRILVVDDNIDSAEMMTMLLQTKGYHVSMAHDAAAALSLLALTVHDAAFIDIGLPGTDGFELATQIRALPGFGPSMQLFALTGHSGAKYIERSRQVGFDHHFVKPAELADLLAALEGAGPASHTVRSSTRSESQPQAQPQSRPFEREG